MSTAAQLALDFAAAPRCCPWCARRGYRARAISEHDRATWTTADTARLLFRAAHHLQIAGRKHDSAAPVPVWVYVHRADYLDYDAQGFTWAEAYLFARAVQTDDDAGLLDAWTQPAPDAPAFNAYGLTEAQYLRMKGVLAA